MQISELRNFLVAAQLPHAKGTSNAKRLDDSSILITYEDGPWKFRDEFYGGEPYGGREIIHYNNKPVWIMAYYGKVHDTELSADEVYDFLRESLQHPPKELPLRGPERFRKNSLEYINKVSGDLTGYVGKEIILENGREIYWAQYSGGLVDQRVNTGF